MVVLFVTVTLVAAAPPKLTSAPARNPVPVMVTAVPPPDGPEPGETPLTVGGGLDGGLYVNAFCSVADWPSVLVTETLTVPAECAGLVAVIEVLLTTVTLAAAAPPML